MGVEREFAEARERERERDFIRKGRSTRVFHCCRMCEAVPVRPY